MLQKAVVCSFRPRSHSAERILSALRQASDILDGPVSIAKYRRLRRSGPGWPSAGTVVHRFGSWADALRAAGIAVSDCPRADGFGKRKFSDAEILAALRGAVRERAFSIREYDDLAEARGWPKSVTVRKRFGSWTAAVEAAGLPSLRGLQAEHRRLLQLERARPALDKILSRRTFLTLGDGEASGVSLEDLKAYCAEEGVPLLRSPKLGAALVETAEAGFPENGDPRGRAFALEVAAGKTLAEVGRKAGFSKERVRQLIMQYCGGDVARFLKADKISSTEFIREKALDIVRELALKLGRRPELKDYEQARLGNPEWPSVYMVRRCNGKWRGLVAEALGRPDPQRVLDTIALLFDKTGELPRLKDYKEARLRNPELPSVNWIYLHFGGWRKAVLAALSKRRKSGGAQRPAQETCF